MRLGKNGKVELIRKVPLFSRLSKSGLNEVASIADELQVPGLCELGRVVKPGGTIRLLEYVRPSGAWRRFLAGLWTPWIAWAYGASFDRNTEAHIRPAGLDLVESRFVVEDLIKLIEARAPAASP